MKKHIFVTILAAMTLGLVACGNAGGDGSNNSAADVKLSKLTVSGDYKKSYKIDEEFDPTNFNVTAHYSDETTKALTYNTGADTDYTVRGFDTSTSGPITFSVSYKENNVSKSVQINDVTVEEKEIPSINIVISLTVNGIDTYEDNHSVMWLNSPVLGTDGDKWKSAAMTRVDETHVWTLSVDSVLTSSSYYYDFYYGNADSPSWDETYGKNVNETGGTRAFKVEEGTTTYSFNETFVLKPVDSTISVDLGFDATIVESEDASPSREIKEGLYVWAWNNISNNNVRFEYDGSDQLWHYNFNVDLVQGAGSFKVTFFLGSESTAWLGDDYVAGQWEGDEGSKTFQKWESIEFNVTSETTSITYNSVYFKAQPDLETESNTETKYNVTFKFVMSDGSDLTWLNLFTGSSNQADQLSWEANFWNDEKEDNTFVTTVSYEEGKDDFNFSFKGGRWVADNDNYEPAWIGGANGVSYHLALLELGEVTVVITCETVINAATTYVGNITTTTNCTVTLAE